jgi:hypothetical protein
LFTYTTNATMKWEHGFHRDRSKFIGGYFGGLSFADGGVRYVKSDPLNSIFQKELLATNRLAVP